MATPTLRAWMEKAPFTLALSSSFFGFYSHCGVASALYEQGLLPKKITGSSAGALIGGALSSGLTPKEARDILFTVKKKDFWDPALGFGLLRGQKFLDFLERHLVPSFKHTKIPLEVCVFDILACKTRFLSDGPLPKAVVASCAVPLMFHPVRIGRKVYFDGGVFHKSGINHKNPKERILSVYLQKSGAYSEAYELNRNLPRLSPSQKILRIKGLPAVDHNSLELGKQAYTEAYKRCMKALDLPATGNMLDV